jgi:hypothetical protein
LIADSTGVGINPVSVVLGSLWQMVCGLLGMAHVHPHQVAYLLLGILAIEVLLHIRKAITGKSSWSLEDRPTTSDHPRIES